MKRECWTDRNRGLVVFLCFVGLAITGATRLFAGRTIIEAVDVVVFSLLAALFLPRVLHYLRR